MKNKYLMILLATLLVSCDKPVEEVTGTWKIYVATDENIISTANTRVTPFNTVMQVNYFLNDKNEDNESLFSDISDLYNSEVARLHKVFDRHNKYKVTEEELLINVKTINDSFGKNETIKCSDELYNLLKFSVDCYKLTNGYFNVFSGVITDFWNQIFDIAYNDYSITINELDPLYNQELKEQLELITDSIPSNIEEINQQITFDDENKTVTFNECEFNNGINPMISVGGIAKGYATDIIKEKFVSKGYKDGYLISGGSSISTIDKPIYSKDSLGQKISVINPELSNIISKVPAITMYFTDEFNYSTSGNYTDGKHYNFMDGDNMIYRHHIINPYTGYPESYYRSVSIKTSYFSNAYVDAFSTAFMNLSIEDGKLLKDKILKQFPGSDLELFYLTQTGKKDSATFTVYATSNVNGTLTAGERVNIIYEE